MMTLSRCAELGSRSTRRLRTRRTTSSMSACDTDTIVTSCVAVRSLSSYSRSVVVAFTAVSLAPAAAAAAAAGGVCPAACRRARRAAAGSRVYR